MKNLFLTLALIVSFFKLSTAQPSTLPPFVFYTLDGKAFTDGNLKQNTATFVFNFDPGCDHCQAQSDIIKKSIDKFKGSQILYVTWEMDKEKVKAFQQKYFSDVVEPNITFTQDNDYAIDKFFGETTPPTIYVFDKQKKFVKVFKDKEANAEELYSLIK